MLVFLVLCLVLCVGDVAAMPQSPPVVAGLSHDGLDARVRGLVLLGELGCAACHDAGRRSAWIETKAGPDLAAIGARVRPEYLRAFLADPYGQKPGTTMPDVLRGRSARERGDAVEALTHFLVASSDGSLTERAPDRSAAERGRSLFRTIGCAACHAPRDAAGDETTVPGSVPLGRLERKYGLDGLIDFLDAPHRVRPAGRMPDFHLSPQESNDLGHYLLERVRLDPRREPFVPDAAKVTAGEALFRALGCAQCHPRGEATPTAAATSIDEWDPANGCLADVVAAAPDYALSDRQRSDIRAVLDAPDFVPSDEQRVRKSLAALNCVACHARGEFGGVTEARNALFESHDLALGEPGRLPPTLTGVGGKLQSDWLTTAMAYGQSIRPYVKTRMPGFGTANTRQLATLFERVDRRRAPRLEPLPKDRKEAEEVNKLGHLLVGNQGLSCITCHTFGGRGSGAMAGLDIADGTTERLEWEWFHDYMLDPIRFVPGTVMPRFFPDGKSVRTDLLDGDARRQLSAIWHYLQKGRNARQPRGIVREKMELVVGDEAVMLRRSVQNTGKRGISVGYPGDVNFTFDAESIGLNQIWWGKFVDPGGVFGGQGSGQARLLGRDRVSLPKGPAFVTLPDADAPWPTKSRRELGDRFLGYDLDSKQRPTFRYVCDGVTITDATRELPVSGLKRPLLRRTLDLASAADKILSFRAVVDEGIANLGHRQVRVGRALHIHFHPHPFRVRDVGDVKELLVDIPIREGRASLTIDYAWEEPE